MPLMPFASRRAISPRMAAQAMRTTRSPRRAAVARHFRQFLDARRAQDIARLSLHAALIADTAPPLMTSAVAAAYDE